MENKAHSFPFPSPPWFSSSFGSPLACRRRVTFFVSFRSSAFLLRLCSPLLALGCCVLSCVLPSPSSPPPSTVCPSRPLLALAAEITSCSQAACIEEADADDLAYINDNELTLFCDADCFDNPDDAFGGLWCNMRGLGQPCRACRSDK